VHASIARNAIGAFGGEAYALFSRVAAADDGAADARGAPARAAEAGDAAAAFAALNFSAVATAAPPAAADDACPYLRGRPERARNVAHMASLRAAWRLLEAFEAARGWRFDVVVSARPDVAWLAPLPAWRAWPLDGARAWYPGFDWSADVPARAHGAGAARAPPFPHAWANGCFETVPSDWAMLGTRAAAAVYFSLADRFDACDGPFARPLAPCCGDGITASLMGLMAHSAGVAAWARWPFPLLLVRAADVAALPRACSERVERPAGAEPFEGLGGDWLARCAARPVPGCVYPATADDDMAALLEAQHKARVRRAGPSGGRAPPAG